MAHLLFRIGRWSALRPLVVIIAWVTALFVAAGSYLAFGGTLNDTFSIPGTETERVATQMGEQIPGSDGSTARVVFQTQDGSAFTDEQQAGVVAALQDVAGMEYVANVLDPFAQEAMRAEQEAQLIAGLDLLDQAQSQLDDTSAQLDAAQADVDAGSAQVAAGQEQLDAAIEQARKDGTYEAAASQFAAQQAALDASSNTLAQSQAQIDAGRAQAEAGATELSAQAEQLNIASQVGANAAEIRTVSVDGSAALGAITFDGNSYELPQASKDDIVETIAGANIPGVTVDFSNELVNDVGGVLGIGEVVGVVLALIVLLVMMRAVLPAIQPIITSLVGVGVGTATALAFSGVVEMQSVSPVLGVMLALAVGIDYSLFIVNRHRKQLKQGMDVAESVGLANGTAGNAVVFAGATVLIALLALNVTGVPFLGIMGSVAAFGVGIAVLAAVTFTPALLGAIGHHALERKARASIGAEQAPENLAPMRTSRAVFSAVAAVALLAIIAIPSTSMRLGLPNGAQADVESTEYRAYFAIADNFGEGLNGTMLVTASLPAGVPEEQVLAEQARVGNLIMGVDNIVAVAPAGVSDDRSFLAFQVIPAEGPASIATEEAMYALRALTPLDDGTDIGVAGEASANVDISEKLANVLPLYLAVVVGLSLIILMVVFRSLLVPVFATAGFVLSLSAAFGAVTAVYQWGWLGSVFGVTQPGPVLNFLPILLTGILFGLAMDYQLFITTGMRESFVHGAPSRLAVVAGLRHGRAVVTAAAIIMASVFGGFMFSHVATIRPMGFGLALGVLLDAFVVRMVIIPALMHLAGDRAWWLPTWLDRLLPNVDVEGSQLEREHPIHDATPATAPAATS